MKVTMLITLVLSFTSHIALATEPLPLESHFSEDELQWLKEEGTATVKGKAYIKLADGSYKGCDGFNIELLPATSYSSERIQKTYGNTQQGQILISQNPPKFTPDPKAYHELTLKAKCGENDAFVFENVPQGRIFRYGFYHLAGIRFFQNTSRWWRDEIFTGEKW